jgi:hypothetical protein
MRNRIGRPRFMQSFASAGGGPFLATPPSDGETYGVRNGDTWIEVCEEAPKNGTLYGRISNAWQPIPSGGDPGTASGVLFTPAGDISATNVQAAIQELDNEKVAKAGSTMTGFLTLHANPDAPMKAATKQYVDTALGNAGVTISDTAPTPNQGKMWWESDTGVLWMSYTDASSTQWIGVGGTTAAISDASKADKTYVDAQDALKADKTYVDSQNTTQNTAIGLKADKTYVDTQDALKVNEAGDTMTGTLTINAPAANAGLRIGGDGWMVLGNFGGTGLWGYNGDPSDDTKARWGVITSGGGVEANFAIARCDDVGNILDNALHIHRSTGAMQIASTTPSTSPTSGALTVVGGAGIGQDICIGRYGKFGGQVEINNTFGGASLSLFSPSARELTISYYQGGVVQYTHGVKSGEGSWKMFAGTSSDTTLLQVDVNGSMKVFGSSDSSSSTTGALTVAGGVGIGGSLYVDGDARIFFLGLNGPGYSGAILTSRFLGASHFGALVDDMSSVPNSTFILFSRDNVATFLGGIANNNNVGVIYNTTSDERFKPNRERLALGYARDIIDGLEVYDFDKDGNDIRGIGLIAQQAHATHKSLATPASERVPVWMAEKAAPMPFIIANVQQLNQRLDALEKMFESNNVRS